MLNNNCFFYACLGDDVRRYVIGPPGPPGPSGSVNLANFDVQEVANYVLRIMNGMS